MASKGKGKPGDAAGAPVVPAEGAKFMTVRCGSDVDSIDLMINLNCTIDVMLDGIRSAVLSKLDAAISTRKIAIDIASADDREAGNAAAPATAPADATATAGAAAAAPPVAEESSDAKSLAKLIEIKAKITEEGAVIDLADEAGALLNVREQAKRVACEGVLNNRGRYTLAAIARPAEGAAAPAPYMCFASVTAPVAAAVVDPKAKKK